MKEKVLNLLEGIYEAKTDIDINDLLDLKSVEEYKELIECLDQLVNEFKIFRTKKNKYLHMKNVTGIKIGRISINKKGYGFVILEKEDDLYISEREMNGAIQDDVVMAEITREGVRREGRVIKIIKRELNTLVGEIIKVNNKLNIKLDDDKIGLAIKLNKETIKDCVEGHKVVIKLTRQLEKKRYLADVVKIIGHKDDPGVDILSIAYKHQINNVFSKEVEDEVLEIPTEVTDAEKLDRVDLTNEVIFTIDGANTKDIDDAISIKKAGDNYILGVHIADVSHYVKDNTALGDEAYERGTSAYLADTVIPMLPHKLSNGICSLNEGVERLTLSCIMTINPQGKVIDYDIKESIIKSCKKMTYKCVNDILIRDIIEPGYENYVSELKEMHKLAKILRQEKISRGYIDFDLDEAAVVQDENGKAIDIIKRVREEGEVIIEDFMICANETIASHLFNMDLPFIYRTHGNPKMEKIDDFINLVKILGYEIKDKISEPSPKSMQKILKELDDKKEFKILSSLLLRSMKKAEYTKENFGHFGLASKAYTHFTSPIRRYPDLIVHRLLRKYLFERDLSMATISYYDAHLQEIAEHCSQKEVDSVNAERDVLDMKMAEYMEQFIGTEYNGIISTVTNFGFFVELENLVEGLVHVSTLKGDYYNYIATSLALIGQNTKKTYRIGDEVRVILTNASKETSMIDFEVIEKEDKNETNRSEK